MMENIIEVRDVKTILETRVVHDGLNLSIKKGEIYGTYVTARCQTLYR